MQSVLCIVCGVHLGWVRLGRVVDVDRHKHTCGRRWRRHWRWCNVAVVMETWWHEVGSRQRRFWQSVVWW